MRIRAIFLSSWLFYVDQMSVQIASWESSMYRPCRHAKMLRQATRRLKKSLAVRTEPLLNKQDANAWPAGRLTRYKGMMQTVTSPRVEGAWAEGYSQYLSHFRRLMIVPGRQGVLPPIGRRSTQKRHMIMQNREYAYSRNTTNPAFD